MDRPSPSSLARSLALIPHPEGGYYKEVFRSADESALLPPRFGSERPPLPYCTSIYYLVEAPDFSAFHRIKADELWYFHAGTGIAIHCLCEDGVYRRLELGPWVGYFGAVAAGTWFAAEPCIPGPAGAEPCIPGPAGAEPCILGPAGAEPCAADSAGIAQFPAPEDLSRETARSAQGNNGSLGRPWALVSCAVSPGFDFRDFELAGREALGRRYPDRKALIERLTRV
jgi:uncharacterized protein